MDFSYPYFNDCEGPGVCQHCLSALGSGRGFSQALSGQNNQILTVWRTLEARSLRTWVLAGQPRPLRRSTKASSTVDQLLSRQYVGRRYTTPAKAGCEMPLSKHPSSSQSTHGCSLCFDRPTIHRDA